MAEDGPIDASYTLTETPRADYLQRTEWNLRDSDGTVIFTLAELLSVGSKRTEEFATKHGKPCVHLSAAAKETGAEKLKTFIQRNGIAVLNVAETRGSKEPGVRSFVTEILDQL